MKYFKILQKSVNFEPEQKPQEGMVTLRVCMVICTLEKVIKIDGGK